MSSRDRAGHAPLSRPTRRSPQRSNGAFLAAFVLAASCGREQVQTTELEPPTPGLAADPRWLTFTCDAPSCEGLRTTRVSVVGPRPIAVKRIALEGPARESFQVTPSRATPFVLSPKDTLEIAAARRAHARGGDAWVRLTFGDASASESDPNRVAPGVLDIPLVARTVGEAELRVLTAELDFGAVAPGDARTRPIELHAEGSGNARVTVAMVESDDPSVSVDLPDHRTLAVGGRLELPAVYAPTDERYVEGRLEVFADDAPEPISVRFRGTSVRGPRLIAPPPEALDLGSIPRGSAVLRALVLENQGGAPLRIERVQVLDLPGSLVATLTGVGTATAAEIRPLGSAPLALRIEGSAPGEISGQLAILSSDPATPELRLPIRGLVTEPKLTVAPLGIDFGLLPRGWSLTRTIELSNSGFGPLTLERLEPALGTSALFTIRPATRTPVRVERGQRVGIEVEFRAEAEGEFRGTITVNSDDPNLPYFEIPLRGRGASCAEGCPIPHGAPACAEGVCAVGACEPGWFDVDRSPATGCECSDPVGEPANFCAEAERLGDLNDDGTSAVVLGVLPTPEDIDVVRFFADDTDLDVFGDDYEVRIRLESDDPAIRFCVSRRESDNPSSECVFQEEVCPEDRNYRRGGGILSDQSADYVVRVFRAGPTTEATCTGYSLFLANG